MKNYKVNLQVSVILILISIVTGSFFGIDKFTSENPADEAAIYIGLSDKDSSSCDICMPGGEYYDSGCKRCIQDGISLTVNSMKNNYYSIVWNNNNVLGYGDKNCVAKSDFLLTQPNSDDTFWVEIIKNKNIINSTLYTDKNFKNVFDFNSLKICSEPNNLQYIKISNNDGQSFGNGGKILSYIDDIEIFEKNFNSSVTFQDNPDSFLKLIYQEDFSKCNSKTCNDTWVLQDPSMFYVDIDNQIFNINSQISGTIDYAHYDLGIPLSNDFWILKFKMHIDTFEAHPSGKGILNLDPQLRQLLFGLPTFIFPLVSFLIIKKSPSKLIGFLIIINGLIISLGIILQLILLENFETKNILQYCVAISFGVFISILGILIISKIKKL